MRKNIGIISSSPRKGGNSETLAASFAKGAQDAGNHVETIYLREKQIVFCKGCLACLKIGHCVIKDDAVEIAAKMHDADVLVFATQVYYYSVSGQLKTMLDRATRCSALTMLLRRPIFWRRRRRMMRRRWRAPSRRYKAGWTVLTAVNGQKPSLPAESTALAILPVILRWRKPTKSEIPSKNGITKEEIAEILTHAAFYAGWPKAWAAFRMAKEVWNQEDAAADAKEKHADSMLFPIGQPNDAYAPYFIGKSYLAPVSTDQVGIFNVTFEPGCHNNWHIHHAHNSGGQILICVGGRGFYQEWGKKAVELLLGDVVNILAGVKHWHGAAPDSWFSHLAVEAPGEETANEWLEAVNDSDYLHATTNDKEAQK